MSYEAWPSPEARRGPLPRIEDLPLAEPGYDQEAVRQAFDAFYRHAAQLDASLKALEAVEAFRREAAELRGDLRSLWHLGYGPPDPGFTQSEWDYGRRPLEVPPAVPRLAAESALLIAVAVVAGVAGFRSLVIVAVMAAALAIVLIVEVLAGRARTRVAGSVYVPFAVQEPAEEPAPHVEPAAALEAGFGWSAFESAERGTPFVEVGDASEDTQEEVQAEVEDAAGKGAAPLETAENDAAPEAAQPEEHEEAEARDDENGADALRPVAVGGEDDESWERGFDGDGEDGVRGRGFGRLLRRRR
jgi:hypothetical protein